MTNARQQFRPRGMRSLATVAHEREFSSAISFMRPVERLQMNQGNYHQPVLEKEITDLLAAQAAGVVIDATLGGGGHTAALLARAPQLRVLGIDRDDAAHAAASIRLAEFGERVRMVKATFAEMAEVVNSEAQWINKEPIVGILLDLGVSSRQLDDPTRGFSFRADAPLDMRMDPTAGESAADYIARVDVHELVAILRENGESRFAGAIAHSMKRGLPRTTNELTACVEAAVPMAARRRGHVATRAFQALRIAVNGEAEQLASGLAAAMNVLSTGGLLVVISYHSGEDRVVKEILHEAHTGGCRCPVVLGCVCGAVQRVEVFKASAILPSSDESELNPRARSARLRIARKVAP